MRAVAEHKQCATPATSITTAMIVIRIKTRDNDNNTNNTKIYKLDNSKRACQSLLDLCSSNQVSPSSDLLWHSLYLLFSLTVNDQCK